MINYSINIALIATLFICVYQDFKSRLVHVALLIIILSLGLIYNYRMDWGWISPLKSLLFLVGILGGGFVMHSIIKKRPLKDFYKYFGVGDMVFLVAIIPLFSYLNYGLFVISGILLSILFHFAFYVIHKNPQIPLVGYLSIYLSGLLNYSFVNPSFLKMDIL